MVHCSKLGPLSSRKKAAHTLKEDYYTQYQTKNGFTWCTTIRCLHQLTAMLIEDGSASDSPFDQTKLLSCKLADTVQKLLDHLR
jgi:hypothetical protein